MGNTHGVVCVDGSSPAGLLEEWLSSDAGVHYETEDVAITTAPQGCRTANRSVATGTGDDAIRCWVIGDIYGYDRSAAGHNLGGYVTRPEDVTPAEFLVSHYDRHGFDSLSGLNGNFTAIVYDEARRELALCTDRFGTVPLYWTQLTDGTFVFSSNIQFLPFHPDVETEFDAPYLHEYLAFRRTFGVKTPFTGIEKLEPGTVTTVSLEDGSMRTDQYWRPRYRPRDESVEWFVDELASRFQTVVDEWTRDNRDYGVLLSGGSDSRLVLAALDDATAFHMNDWMNREAQVAERVALEADIEFELLERGAEYRIASLERNRCAGSFNGWFTQPYTSGFDTELTGRVDGLLSGLYADSLFGNYGIPSPEVSLGPLGSMTIPTERSVETIDDYIDLLLEDAHDGHRMPTDLRSVLEANIYRDGETVVHHGVTYDSLEELVYYGNCYPLSNDDDMRFHTGLRRTLPYRSPFLDNRLLDLSLSVPIRYRLRRDLVGRATERLDPSLATIPHASTGMALSQPFAKSYVGEHLRAFYQKHVSRQSPPAPYLTNGPWLDDAELLRSFDFAGDVLESNDDLLEELPGLDPHSVSDLYHAHQRGEERVGELYTLLTVLTMPVTEHVLETQTSDRTDDVHDQCGRCLKPEVVSVA
ncbi:asparagine synthase-related protein [Natronorubrum daqingense]|uniref:Asparagine synthase n=1 Tax=Natronorubrum daqingense TaxID=588898 RepID=A0A1N7C5X5_9EURY|nr:asparagine synthase-related protein [Natronorubrum daqingense]APX96750.1 asparagine synthase [Natronorubrum daqingense]SIR58864.1 asparagine synthase (glutamine-hydrolysing) [Natronorubrum daqingense]